MRFWEILGQVFFPMYSRPIIITTYYFTINDLIIA